MHLSSLWHPFTFRMLANEMSIHNLWKGFKDLLKLLEYFEILRACNICFCSFDQSMKEYIAYNRFSWACHIYLLFFLHPQNTWGWERVGTRPLRLGQLKKEWFLFLSWVMPSILWWSFIWRAQVDSRDNQKMLWYCVLACIFHWGSMFFSVDTTKEATENC